jgi:uncharacterized RDD family membrane protein YckC
MALGIRVVDHNGSARVALGQSALRAAIWVLMAAPAGLGFISAVIDPDRRGWHDRSAGTRVIRAPA